MKTILATLLAVASIGYLAYNSSDEENNLPKSSIETKNSTLTT